MTNFPKRAAAATAAARRALRDAGQLDAVSQVNTHDSCATNDPRDGLVFGTIANTRTTADADAVAETLRSLEWVEKVTVHRFDDGAPMFVAATSHAFHRVDGVATVIAPEPVAESSSASASATVVDTAPEVATVEPAAQTMNREAWLTAAVDMLRPMFAEDALVELPATIRVSVGFPGGKSPRKVIGQCWYTGDDKAAQVFVSPVLVDPIDVLGVLVHELIHAWDGGKSKHKGAFRRVAVILGLEGKMTATTVGDALRARLQIIADTLGTYPHARLNLAASAVKTQTTRMLKVECPACGYTLRTTAKWLEVGTPTCPCGTDMEAAA